MNASIDSNPPATLQRILRTCRTIAVVGLSAEPQRASFGVARYMQERGYRIVPVNPRYAATGSTILGETCAMPRWPRFRFRWTWWMCFAVPKTCCRLPSKHWPPKHWPCTRYVFGSNWALAIWRRMRWCEGRAWCRCTTAASKSNTPL